LLHFAQKNLAVKASLNTQTQMPTSTFDLSETPVSHTHTTPVKPPHVYSRTRYSFDHAAPRYSHVFRSQKKIFKHKQNHPSKHQHQASSNLSSASTEHSSPFKDYLMGSTLHPTTDDLEIF
jgi:hypothetical protein